MARARELTPEQIRNLCMSFAQLGYFNTQFKSIMADTVIEKIGQFEPAVLADTAWAFGEANYYDYNLMSTLLPYLKTNIANFDAGSMAKVRQVTSCLTVLRVHNQQSAITEGPVQHVVRLCSSLAARICTHLPLTPPV